MCAAVWERVDEHRVERELGRKRACVLPAEPLSAREMALLYERSVLVRWGEVRDDPAERTTMLTSAGMPLT